MKSSRPWALPLLGLGFALYAWASYWMMAHHPQHPAVVAILFGPLLAGMATSAWAQRRQLWAQTSLALCAVACAWILWALTHGGVADAQWLYVLQHGAINLALAGLFALSLRPGQTPLISALAERVHREFTPAMRQYTGRLTWAWVLYFLAIVAASAWLYALAPWPWWSLFCNVLTPLSVGLFLALEWLWRSWQHPEFEKVNPRMAWQAWRSHHKAQPAGASLVE